MKAPKHPCAYPTCRTLVEKDFRWCDEHRRARFVEDRKWRGSARERGYTRSWEKLRRAYLNEHPLCVHHQRIGEIVPATVVDHIKPHRGDGDLFWDPDNLQALCKECHDRKTVLEDGGLGFERKG